MPDIGAIEPIALKARLDRGENVFVLDVREAFEIFLAPFPGATHIPMGDIPSRLTELDPDRGSVVVCQPGLRSAPGPMYLGSLRFAPSSNLSGGLHAWSEESAPSTPRCS